MTRGLIVAAVAAVSAGVLAAQPPDTTRNPLAASADAGAAGKRLFEQGCQSCHGPAGQGDRGPALDRGSFAPGADHGDLFHAIRAGGPGPRGAPFPRPSHTP